MFVLFCGKKEKLMTLLWLKSVLKSTNVTTPGMMLLNVIRKIIVKREASYLRCNIVVKMYTHIQKRQDCHNQYKM